MNKLAAARPDSPIIAFPSRPDPLAMRPRALHFPARATIYRQGEPAGTLYRVETGAVRIYRLTADGHRRIDSFRFAGEVFGMEPGTQRRFFAETVQPSELAPLPANDDAEAVLPLAVENLIQAQDHLMILGYPHAIERVARFLLDLDRRQGHLPVVTLAMSRADIADYLGLTIETVSRCFTRLKCQRFIRLTTARSVEILDRAALAGVSE
jgi:CRP/FNR family nitrogen fixation transcriptional regulator